MSTFNFPEAAKAAKAIVAWIFAAAVAFLAYPDLVPLPAQWKAAATTAAVALTGVAVWIKKNKTAIEAASGSVDGLLVSAGVIPHPEVEKWAEDALQTLQEVDPDPVSEPVPVVPE